MKIIELEQGSPEWLAWRKTVITATDCSAIRGSLPVKWGTPYKIWKKKLGQIPEGESNEAMERGKRLEPLIRARFIEKYGINMTPMVIESSEYSFLGASLDGRSDCGKYLLEVKTGGKKLHDMAKDGIVPPYYMDQMQQQLLASKAEKVFYVVGGEEEDSDIVIEVFPDEEFEQEYIPVAREFWRCVAFNEPPPLKESDYRDMSENPTWVTSAPGFREVCKQIKALEEVKKSFRQELLTSSENQHCVGMGVKVTSYPTAGTIDYDAMPDDLKAQVEKYRKPSTTVWKVSVA